MRRFLTCLVAMPMAIATMGAAPPADNPQPTQAVVPLQNRAADTKLARSSPSHKAVRVLKPYQVGTASWYGRRFHGRTTASGEPFNMFNLTAAHRTLPLGAWVKVTNIRNGQSVIVRINDRGPVPQSRIIDLSFEAATLLDLRAHGVERVRLDLVRPVTLALALNVSELQ